MVVKATLLGIKRAEVDITIIGDTLNVKGESKAEGKIKRGNYLYREYRYGTFSPPVTLPGGLDTLRCNRPQIGIVRQSRSPPRGFSYVY